MFNRLVFRSTDWIVDSLLPYGHRSNLQDVQSPRSMSAMNVPLALLFSATVFAATAWTQIPQQATWEITFNQVEAAANLSDLRNARSDSFEARLMERPWSSYGPLPFLRLAQVRHGARHAVSVLAPYRCRPESATGWTRRRLP